MTTTINADNGVVSGSAGLKTRADSSGVLALQTNGTTAISIDTSQAVTFAGAVSLSGNQTTTGNLTVNGNTTLGDASTDTILMTGAPSIGGAGYGMGMGFRNRIINGAMVIDQRGSASSPVATGYGVDRFTYGNSGAGVVTFGQSTTAPAGFINSSLVTVTTADSSIANADIYYIYQQIEGLNVADLGFGTASAQTVTLSFWVRSSVTGTYGAVITNSAGNRSYVSNYTISAANTWEQKTITVAGDTTGTWLTTNGIGLSIRWGLAAGSNWQGTAGVWGTANAVCSSSQVNFMATVGNTFYITGVQLEKGSTATAFDFRSYGTELALCQRYYAKQLSIATFTNFGIGTGLSATNASIWLKFNVTMRSAPTIAVASMGLSDGQSLYAITSLSTGYIGTDSALLQPVVSSGLTQYRPYQLQANNSASAYVEYSSEL